MLAACTHVHRLMLSIIHACTDLCMLSCRGPKNTQVCSCTQKSQLCWCRFGCNCVRLSDIHQCLQTRCIEKKELIHPCAKLKLAMNTHRHTQTLNHTCGPARVHVLTCTHHTISLQGIASHTTAMKSVKCVNAGLAAIVFTSLTFINIYKEHRVVITGNR